MTPADMAAVHRRAFGAEARVWRAAEFAQFLADPRVICVAESCAFALARIAGDEAEVLTLACDPDCQRQGLGRRCLLQLIEEARQVGVRRMFLDVAADNCPAIALYSSMGFEGVGRRTGYYRRAGSVGVDALVLQKTLAAPG